MSAEVRQSGPNRNRWMLPVILLVVIAAIIAAVLIAKNRSSASSSPTSTPTPAPLPTATHGAKTIVVTATPGGVTPTPGGPPTPTLVSVQGGSTPLPHATPVPTVVGLTLGEISRPQHEVQTIQSGANAGDSRYTYHLNPTRTVNVDLQAYGFKAGLYQIVKPSPAGPTPTPQQSPGGRPVINYIVSYKGKQYAVAVAQVVKAGPKGIWVIVTILPSS
jgi:hypothetical protein